MSQRWVISNPKSKWIFWYLIVWCFSSTYSLRVDENLCQLRNKCIQLNWNKLFCMLEVDINIWNDLLFQSHLFSHILGKFCCSAPYISNVWGCALPSLSHTHTTYSPFNEHPSWYHLKGHSTPLKKHRRNRCLLHVKELTHCSWNFF